MDNGFIHSSNIATDSSEVCERKDRESLIAKLALAGHQVRKGSNNDFLVSKWGMTRYCTDFAALRSFAIVLGRLS